MLAAEIGKSLLENNIRLKSSYEDLLKQTQKSCNGAPLPTPSSSLATNLPEGNDSGIDESTDEDYDDDDEPALRFVPSHRTREAMIEVLERKNVELTKRLETALEEKEAADKSNTKRVRKLEAEIETLKSNLEIATTKIHELEEMNERQRRLEAMHSTASVEASKAEDSMIDELLNKIEKLELQNNLVSNSKQELETKLANTLNDLCKLKEQFEQFQFTQKDYEALQEAYERQFRHIAELNASVEDHRNVLQKLKERGINIHSSRTTPAPSACASVKSYTFRNTLMGELETEWLKQRSPHVHVDDTCTVGSESAKPVTPTFQPLREFTEKTLAGFYGAPDDSGLESLLAKASGIDKNLLDEALSFISKIEQSHDETKCLDQFEYDSDDDDNTFEIFDDRYPSHDLYPSPQISFEVERVTRAPKTFLGRIRRTVRLFFRAVWRWCRFAVILTTAVLISVWNGPEGMLIEYWSTDCAFWYPNPFIHLFRLQYSFIPVPFSYWTAKTAVQYSFGNSRHLIWISLSMTYACYVMLSLTHTHAHSSPTPFLTSPYISTSFVCDYFSVYIYIFYT